MTRTDLRREGPTTERLAESGPSAPARLADVVAPRSASDPPSGGRPVPNLEARRVFPADLSRERPPVLSGHLGPAERQGRRVDIAGGDGPPLTEADLFAGYGLEP